MEEKLVLKNTIKIEDEYVDYARMFGCLINGWENEEIVYAIQTNCGNEEKHKNLVESIVTKLKQQNDGFASGVSWRETRRENVFDNGYCEMSLVAFRVRDIF